MILLPNNCSHTFEYPFELASWDTAESLKCSLIEAHDIAGETVRMELHLLASVDAKNIVFCS
jgi:hypothetical protein